MPDYAVPIPYIYTQPGTSDDGIIIRTAQRRIGIAVWEAHGADPTIWFDLRAIQHVKRMVLDAISISRGSRACASGTPEGWVRTPQGNVLSSLSSRLGGIETDGTIRVTFSADRGIGIGIVEEFEHGSDAEIWTDATIAQKVVEAIEMAISMIGDAC